MFKYGASSGLFLMPVLVYVWLKLTLLIEDMQTRDQYR